MRRTTVVLLFAPLMLFLWIIPINPAFSTDGIGTKIYFSRSSHPGFFVEGEPFWPSVEVRNNGTATIRVEANHTFTSIDRPYGPYSSISHQTLDPGAFVCLCPRITLPEGTWNVTVVLNEVEPERRQIAAGSGIVFIKGAEFAVIERQAEAAENEAFWSQLSVIISPAAAAGAAAIGFFAAHRVEGRRIAHERALRWKELYDAHSKLLAEEIANLWKTDSGIFAGHQIQNNRFVSLDPVEPASQYTEKVKDHLRNGYSDIWQLYENGRVDSLKIRNDMESIAIQLKEKVALKVGQALPDLPQASIWTPRMRRLYDLEFLASAILHEIKWAIHYGREITKTRHGKFDPGTGEILTQLHLTNTHLATGTETDMATLKQVVDQLLTDNEIIDLVRRYAEKEKELAENNNIVQFHNGLNVIVSDIRAGLPIKGKKSCQICRNLYEHIFKDSDKD